MENTIDTKSRIMSSLNHEAPRAEKIEKKLEIHGDERIDNYYWLNDRENQKVIDYLNAENSYTDSVLHDTKDLQTQLFEEIKGRIKATDMSVPYKKNGYHYLTRYEEGKEYPIYSRKKGTLDAEEEIMLDVNVLAKDFSYYSVSGNSVSPNNELLSYGEDTLSRRIYTIRFKNLVTGEMLSDVIPNTTGRAVWANDNKTLFYTRKDETLRGYKIFRHTLGTDAANDKEIYHEEDATFGCFVYKTKSEDYIVIGSYATLSAEYRILDANEPNGEFKVFQPRERDLEYGIYHEGSKFYIVTNLDAKNFRLMECPEDKTSKDNWKEVIAHRDDVLLSSIDVFSDYLVVSERNKGLTQLRIIPNDGEEHYIEFDDEAYLAYTSANPEFNTDVLRYGFTSLTTPNSTFDYNMVTKEKDLLKMQEVVGDFNSENYSSKRIMAKARDGVEVPISIVYHKDTEIDGTAPLLLYAYGSYGSSSDLIFRLFD